MKLLSMLLGLLVLSSCQCGDPLAIAGEDEPANIIPTGTDCAACVDGQDGAPGLNGLDGTPGRDGVDGQNGKDGLPGVNGLPGTNGLNSLVAIFELPEHTLCRHGGLEIQSGLDLNNNSILEVDEIQSIGVICTPTCNSCNKHHDNGKHKGHDKQDSNHNDEDCEDFSSDGDGY